MIGLVQECVEFPEIDRFTGRPLDNPRFQILQYTVHPKETFMIQTNIIPIILFKQNFWGICTPSFCRRLLYKELVCFKDVFLKRNSSNLHQFMVTIDSRLIYVNVCRSHKLVGNMFVCLTQRGNTNFNAWKQHRLLHIRNVLIVWTSPTISVHWSMFW